MEGFDLPILDEWEFFEEWPNVRIRGKVYNDVKKKRFQDGEVMITSPIVFFSTGTGIVHTENSTYVLARRKA